MSIFFSASKATTEASTQFQSQHSEIQQHKQPEGVCVVVTHQAPVYCLEAIDGGLLTGSTMGIVKTIVDEDALIHHELLYEKELVSIPLGLEVREDTLWIATCLELKRGTCEGGELVDFSTQLDDISTMDASPCGEFIVVGGDSERVLLFKADGEHVWQGVTHKYPCRVRLEHSTLTVACWDGVVNTLSLGALPEMVEQGSWMGPYGSLDSYHTPGGMPAFDAIRLNDGRVAAVGVNAEQGFVGFWNVDAPDQVTLFNASAGLHVIERSPDGKWLAMGGNDRLVSIMSVADLSVKTYLDVTTCIPDVESYGHFSAGVGYYDGSGAAAVFSLEWSEDGSSVYIGTQVGVVLAWSPTL